MNIRRTGTIYAVFFNERRFRHWRKSSTMTNKQGVINNTWTVELTIPPKDRLKVEERSIGLDQELGTAFV